MYVFCLSYIQGRFANDQNIVKLTKYNITVSVVVLLLLHSTTMESSVILSRYDVRRVHRCAFRSEVLNLVQAESPQSWFNAGEAPLLPAPPIQHRPPQKKLCYY